MGQENDDKDKDKGVGDKGTQSLTIKLEDGEKTLTAADVVKLVQEHGKISGEHAKFAKVAEVLQKYETDPETYVSQTEAALAVVSKLMEAGVIDNKGNLVEKKGEKDSKGGGFDWKGDSKGDKGGGDDDSSGLKGDDRVAKIVAKALEGIMPRLKGIEETQGSLLQSTLEERVRRAHPDLDADDVERVFEQAYREPKKKLMDHAKAYADRKAEKTKAIKAEVAAELGIDLTEYERRLELKRKMTEKGDPHGALVLAEGKKLTFKPGKDDKSAVSPRDATINFFKNLGVG
jgi:hypothetical protein